MESAHLAILLTIGIIFGVFAVCFCIRIFLEYRYGFHHDVNRSREVELTHNPAFAQNKINSKNSAFQENNIAPITAIVK